MKRFFVLKAILPSIFLFLLIPSEISAKEYSLNTRSIYDFNTIHYESNRNNDYDNDFYQYLSFSSNGYGLDNLSTYLSMRYEQDLDDRRKRDYFRNITDTYGGNNQFKVYNAYVKVSDLLTKFDLTLGRQYFYGAELAHFDGGRIDLKRTGPIDLTFFGGRRVTYYEHPEELRIWGGSFSLYPIDGTRITSRIVKYIDYSYDFSLYQTITPEVDFSGTYSMINNDMREFWLDLNYNSFEFGTQAIVSYYRRLGDSDDDDFDFDYTSSRNRGNNERFQVERFNIGDLSKYEDYYILLHQRIYGGFGIGASYTKRHLINNAEGNQYNNAFDEFTAGVDFSDFIFNGTDLVFNWRYFRNDRNSNRFETKSNVFEGQIAQRLTDKFFIDAGSFFKFYNYNNKHIDTVGFNGDIRAYLTKNFDFRIRYAYEEDDPVVLPFSEVDYIQNVTVEVGFKF